MRSFLLSLTLSALLAFLVASPAGAQVALSVEGGTLGLGVGVSFGLTPHLEGRLGAHAFDYSDRREASGIDYDADARLRNANAFLDLHPGGGGFRLTGGLIWNDNRIDARSIPTSGSYDIGGVLVPTTIVERLDGRADFDPIVPYAGIGWGHPAASDRRFGLSLDLGAVFQGEANVHLDPVIPAGSPILTTPGAREALNILVQREERDLEDEASDYDIYPVLSLGVWYRF